MSEATVPIKDKQPSDATVYRLALYHCYLDDLIRREGPSGITSRQLADALALKEETVRRDISFVGGGGRPGSGYDTLRLQQSLADYLGLSGDCPIITVGSAAMLAAVGTVFPAVRYGVCPVAYFTDEPSDVGKTLGGITIHALDEIAQVMPEVDASVAIIAAEPDFVQESVNRLEEAGVTGFLLLTPVAAIEHGPSTTVHHIRMPCDIKSLACRCRVPVPEEFLGS